MSEEEKLLNDLKDYLNYLKGKNLMTSFRFNIVDLLENSISLIEKQQKETEEKNCLIDVLQHKIEELLDNKKEINYIKPIDIPVHNYINEDKIRDRLKELEEQKEKMKYDGNVCFADYEQFCKNLKFFKEQIEELLEESTNE